MNTITIRDSNRKNQRRKVIFVVEDPHPVELFPADADNNDLPYLAHVVNGWQIPHFSNMS